MFKTENYNYCLAESLSLGLPAIISPGNDLSTELEGTGAAIILKDNTDASLVNGLYEFSQKNHKQLSKMSKNACSFAKNN